MIKEARDVALLVRAIFWIGMLYSGLCGIKAGATIAWRWTCWSGHQVMAGWAWVERKTVAFIGLAVTAYVVRAFRKVAPDRDTAATLSLVLVALLLYVVAQARSQGRSIEEILGDQSNQLGT